MATLITGAAGYLGSHTLVELLSLDRDVVALDDFSRSSADQLKKVKLITGKDFEFVQCSLLNVEELKNLFKRRKIHDVIHFAGLKSVTESTIDPLLYYNVNVTGTINLLDCMKAFGVNSIIFSSSCTVYGDHNSAPYFEEMTLSPVSPYGNSKFMCEAIITDWVNMMPKLNSATSLRYFNPIGAHHTGLLGEQHNKYSNNIMPHLLRAAKENKVIKVFGDDYDTRDGTGERDYIHVIDLAKAHIAASEKNFSGHNIYNIGTGNSTTVLELIDAFETVTGVKVKRQITDRRPGDVTKAYASVNKAEQNLKWQAKYTLNQMLQHAWKWELRNDK